MLIDQQAKIGITKLVGTLDSEYLEELEFLLYKRGRQEDFWNLGDSLWYHLVLLGQVITVEGRLRQREPDNSKEGLNYSEIKVQPSY